MLNQSSPKVSIIIPAYNEEGYLGDCLSAALNQQTKIPYEIIVVNNNSTDNTKKIALAAGVRVIDEKKQGAASARNAGARVAKGKIFCFVDADCIVPRDYLDKVLNLFKKHPTAAAVGGPYTYYDGGPIVKLVTGQMNYFYWYHKMIRLLWGFQTLGGGNLAVKRGAFFKIGGFNEQINDNVIPDDLEFCLRLKKAGLIAVIDPKLKVVSSFRRIKKSPLKDPLRRFWHTIKYCLAYRLGA